MKKQLPKMLENNQINVINKSSLSNKKSIIKKNINSNYKIVDYTLIQCIKLQN